MRKYNLWTFVFITCLCIFSFFEKTKADPAKIHPIQMEKPPILLGTSVGLTSDVEEYARSIIQGLQIYFNKINASGGIQGRKINLIVLDDKFDPIQAAKNTRQLIEKDHVLAIISNLGSATTFLMIPIANELKTLLFCPASVSDLLCQNQPSRYVFRFQACLKEEVSLMIKGLLSIGIKPDEFAFATQNDTLGNDAYEDFLQVLSEAGYAKAQMLPLGRITPNTSNVAGALATIMEEQKKTPKVIGLAMGGEAIPAFMKLASKEFPDLIFYNPSTLMSTQGLEKRLEYKIITSQVVPYLDSDLPAIQEYREDLKKYGSGAKSNTYCLKAYLTAKLFVLALKKAAAENKLTHEQIIDVLEDMHHVDIGIGINISFDKNNHQALHNVWPLVFKNGKFEPLINWQILLNPK